MKNQITNKGIVKFATGFRPFGINLFWLGVLYKAYRERRSRELIVSALYMVQNRLGPVETPFGHTGVDTHTEVFYNFDLTDAPTFRARAQSVYSDENITVAGEYAWPGARILVRNFGRDQLHEPYGTDDKVCHIHAVAHLGQGAFAVTTGDSRKALDLFCIEGSERIEFRRKKPHCAGYTAMAVLDGSLWGGSDFSERANFLINVTEGRKYFLPLSCVREYVIDLKAIDDTRLLLISRRLGTDDGHAIIFCVKDKTFIAANAVMIEEKDMPWEAAPHRPPVLDRGCQDFFPQNWRRNDITL